MTTADARLVHDLTETIAALPLDVAVPPWVMDTVLATWVDDATAALAFA
jgi:hypothetical protein